MKESIYNPEFVRKLFNEMSTSYERMNYLSSFGFSLRWRNQFVRKLPATQEPIRVIDLMTGMGEIWSMMRKRWPEATLHALDFSDGMLKHADRKNKKHFNGQVQLLNQDVLRNNLPDESYDQVTSCFGLKTFDAEQIAGLAAETRRILKPGGQFAFIEVSSPPNSILRFFLRLLPGPHCARSGLAHARQSARVQDALAIHTQICKCTEHKIHLRKRGPSSHL